VYSKTAMLKRTWSNRGIHFSTDQIDYFTAYRAAIVAVNSTMGVVSYEVYNSAVDEKKFIAFLQKLSLCMGGEPFSLFMDRLTVHRMLTVKQEMMDLNIFPIYNCPASPDLNAIETCFAQCKRKYKRERLNALVNQEEFDVV
jgi:hypothetical protein